MTSPKPRVVQPPLPRWVVLVGSLLVVFHLGSVVLNAMSAPSGPWPGRDRDGNPVVEPVPPPHLVSMVLEKGPAAYLRAIKQSHTSHFRSNRPGGPEAYLKIELYDKNGISVKSLRFPDPQASAAVQNRQTALVNWLTEDETVRPSMTEKVAAPGAVAPTITVWDWNQLDRTNVLVEMDENDIPRDRPTFRPSSWSLIVLRSLVRYLCRAHGAESADVDRYHRMPVDPQILQERELQLDTTEIRSSYGRLTP